MLKSWIEDNSSLISRSLGITGNLLGFISGGVVGSFFRSITSVLSFSGNVTGWLAEKFYQQEKDQLPTENKNTSTLHKAKLYLASHQVGVTHGPRVASSLTLVASGIQNNNPAEITSGLVYTISTSMEFMGERSQKTYIAGSLISAFAALSMAYAGASKDEKFQTAAGAVFFVSSSLQLTVNTQRYRNFREMVRSTEAEAGSHKEL